MLLDLILTYLFIFRLPALHQKFDLPAPFVLHTDCPHYWRYHLPGMIVDIYLQIIISVIYGKIFLCVPLKDLKIMHMPEEDI